MQQTGNHTSPQTSTPTASVKAQSLPAKGVTALSFKAKTQSTINLKKPAELTQQDSIKLNLIELYPLTSNQLLDNVLTRQLHPAVVKYTQPVIAPDSLIATDSINIAVDSLRLAKDSLAALKPVTVQPAAEVVMPERGRKFSDLSAQQDWLIPVLIILVAYTGLLRMLSGKYVSNLFKSVFNTQNAENLYNTVNVRNSLPAFGLDVLFHLSISTFAYEALTSVGFNPGLHGSLILLATLIGFSILFALKTGVYRFLSYIFGTGAQTGEFLFYVSLYNRILGMLLLPLVISIPFVSSNLTMVLIQCGLVMIVATYLLQMTRGAKIILRNPVSIFYLFLYLCALEILPLVVIYKLLFP
jgi:hypothetical protein